MLVVDAFTGDGIPIHLLTREALELYLRHVQTEGAILFHISNRYLRLEAVLGNAAHALGLKRADDRSRSRGRRHRRVDLHRGEPAQAGVGDAEMGRRRRDESRRGDPRFRSARLDR